jgi:hypothetical protein
MASIQKKNAASSGSISEDRYQTEIARLENNASMASKEKTLL